MTPREAYDIKRNNFQAKTERYFNFLVSEFEYQGPKYLYHEQPNGSIISDSFEYKNQSKKIIISNAYHPSDYGFEIYLVNTQNDQAELIHFVLKENQDIEQNYLNEAAEILKLKLKK